MITMASRPFSSGSFDTRLRHTLKAVPTVLTAVIWFPPVLTLIIFMTAGSRFFHADTVSRLIPLGLPAVFSLLVCLFLATVCFQKGSRKIQTLVFGGICALWGFLNLDITLLFMLKDKNAALVINRIDHAILVFQLGLCSHYFHSLSAMKKRTVFFAYGFSAFYVPLTQTPYYLKGIHEYPWGMFGSRGILFDILMGVTLLVICFGSRALVRRIRTLERGSIEKKQVVFSFACIIAMALISLANIPAMSGVDVFPFGTFIFVPVLVLIYAVIRYDVVKINLYFKKWFWTRAAMLLTGTGYLLLGALFYVNLQPLTAHAIGAGLFPWALPLLLSLATCFFFSFLSLRIGPTLTGTRLFGLISMVLAYLSADILLNRIVSDQATGLRISRYCHMVLVMWPALCVHLVTLVCRKKAVPLIVFCYAASICFAVSTHSPSYLSGMNRYPWGLFAQRGPLFDVFCLIGLLLMLYALNLLRVEAREQQRLSDAHRLKLFSISIGASVLFALGNLPAMWGYDVYPAGNFIFIPQILFGFAMFRKNLKDALALLYRILYAAGIMGLFGVAARAILPWADGRPWFTVFSGLVIGFYLFRIVEWGFGAFLSFFFHRQKKRLDSHFIQLVDQLSKTKSLDDIADAVWKPVVQEIQPLRLTALFHDNDTRTFRDISRSNPENRITLTEHAPYGSAVQPVPAGHPLFTLYALKRNAVTQEQVESWIADTDLAIDRDDRMRKADLAQAVSWEGHVVCLLLLYGKADGSAYSTQEKEFITRVGAILGPYIENAKRLQRLEHDIEKRTADLSAALSEITLINRFIKAATASLHLEDILSSLHTLLSPIIRFDAVFVQLRDQDNTKLILAKVHGPGISPDIQIKLESLSVEIDDPESLCARCSRTGKRAYITSFLKNETLSTFEQSIHGLLPFTSILVFPMDIRKDNIGNLVMLSFNHRLPMADESMEKLQGYVNQIATAVNNARLYDKAEAAAMVKSDFLSRMSHEIRSPLNAILGMGEALAESSLDNDQRTCVETLLNSGGLLLSVINGILDFSRIEARQLSVESIAFDLHTLMEDIKAMVYAVGMKKGLFIGLDMTPDTPKDVLGDPFKLSQILINLADNAIRFTDQGSITLHVKPGNTSGKSMITFSVADTGIGIPADKISDVFESFSQAESHTTRKYGGTGLGLAISRKLVQLMDGSISVSSTPGRGSRFDVTLPLTEITGGSDCTMPLRGMSVLRMKSSYETDNRHDIAWPEHRGPVSLLVAEDLKTNIQVITHALKGLPVYMDVFHNGYEAVEAFRTQSYDLILMDLHMPVMDGYAAARLVRIFEGENNRTARIPIIALTAYDPNNLSNEKRDDFDDFLLKPFSRNDLISIMIRTLGKRDIMPETPRRLSHVARVLTEEITEELRTMECSLENDDFQTVIRLSHGFKGAAGNCGFPDLALHFSRLHDHAEAGDKARMKDMIRRIRHQTSRLGA